MTSILVTGGTAQLGKPTVAGLRAAGHDVKILSRKSGPGIATGDLETGAGIPEALAGVEVVVHLASTGSAKKDVAAIRGLLDASAAAGVKHFLYMSIVGIDAIPMGYYAGKLESERFLEESGVPFTILRATQFHSFPIMVLELQKYSPVLFAPKISFQTISVDEVAARFVELVAAGPSGRVTDIGGPEQRTMQELAREWKRAAGIKRPIWSIPAMGKALKAFAAGPNMVDGPPYGRSTFEEYLAARYSARS